MTLFFHLEVGSIQNLFSWVSHSPNHLSDMCNWEMYENMAKVTIVG